MTRYAIYFVPVGELGKWGASWLGYDLRTGTLAQSLAPEFVISRPRKYGFHATIRAPFRLGQDVARERLQAHLEELCAGLRSFYIPLKLGQIGRFLALLPAEARAERDVRNLAQKVVLETNDFRAPLTSSERARRRPDKLSPAQLGLLDKWGYPYVLDQFDFHITLTGSLKDEQRRAVQVRLEKDLAPYLKQPLAVQELALCEEDAETGMFRLVNAFSLRKV